MGPVGIGLFQEISFSLQNGRNVYLANYYEVSGAPSSTYRFCRTHDLQILPYAIDPIDDRNGSPMADREPSLYSVLF